MYPQHIMYQVVFVLSLLNIFVHFNLYDLWSGYHYYPGFGSGKAGRYKSDQVIFPKSHGWLVVEPGLRPVSCNHKFNLLLSFLKMYLPPCSLDFSFCLWIPYRDRRDNSDNSFNLVMVSAVAQEGNVKLWTLCSKEKGRKGVFLFLTAFFVLPPHRTTGSSLLCPVFPSRKTLLCDK